MRMIQIDKENMSSDLILLYNSKFVEKIQKTLLQKNIKNHLNHIEEPIISNLDNQKENLIIIVDFEKEVQLDSEFIQLKYFRDILENLDKNTNYKNIVTIISEIGVLGDEIHYFRALQYAAVINIAQAYALRLGSLKIRLNNICVPENFELLEKSTLISLVKFLLSQESMNITGQTLSLSRELLR